MFEFKVYHGELELFCLTGFPSAEAAKAKARSLFAKDSNWEKEFRVVVRASEGYRVVAEKSPEKRNFRSYAE